MLKSVTIPASVTSIEDDAFYGCDALTDVYYAGSESDWGSIAIGESNESLTNAAIHYNAGEEQPTTTTTTTTTTTANPIGDADGNGVVNVMDIQIIKKCVVNTDFAENYTDTADINEDGKITSVDILMLKKIITNGEV